MKAYIISQFFKIENVNIRKEISMTLTCVNKYISIMQITSNTSGQLGEARPSLRSSIVHHLESPACQRSSLDITQSPGTSITILTQNLLSSLVGRDPQIGIFRNIMPSRHQPEPLGPFVQGRFVRHLIKTLS